jgi:hypothetical protein
VASAHASKKRGKEMAGGKTGGFGSSFILSLLGVQSLDELAVLGSSCNDLLDLLAWRNQLGYAVPPQINLSVHPSTCLSVWNTKKHRFLM